MRTRVWASRIQGTWGDTHVPVDQERESMHMSASELQSVSAGEDECICAVLHEFLWSLLVFVWVPVKIVFSTSVDLFGLLCT